MDVLLLALQKTPTLTPSCLHCHYHSNRAPGHCLQEQKKKELEDLDAMLAELGIAPDAPTANGHEDNRAAGKKKKKEKKDKPAGGEQPKQEEGEPEAVERPAAVIEVGRLLTCRTCAGHCCCAVQAKDVQLLHLRRWGSEAACLH